MKQERRVSDKLRVGLIGCGQIAKIFHLKVLPSLPGASLVALADSDSQRLGEAHAMVPEASVFENYQELLGSPNVDAVVICLPTGLHAEAAIAAFQHGRHVYLEKPLATSIDDAEQMLAAWRRSGEVGMIGFNFRYHPLYVKAKQVIKEGRIGKVIAARATFSVAMGDLPAWKLQRQTGGGVLLDLGSHQVDRVRFLFESEVTEVSATVHSQQSEQDNASLTMRLANGILVQGFMSSCSIEEDSLEVFGHRGKLRFDRYRDRGLEIVPTRVFPSRLDRLGRVLSLTASVPGRAWNSLFPPMDSSFRTALEQFVAAAREGRQSRPDFQDGCHSLRVVLAAEEAAGSGRVIKLEESAREGAVAE